MRQWNAAAGHADADNACGADVRLPKKLLATKQESGLAKPGMPRMKCSTFASPA